MAHSRYLLAKITINGVDIPVSGEVEAVYETPLDQEPQPPGYQLESLDVTLSVTLEPFALALPKGDPRQN